MENGQEEKHPLVLVIDDDKNIRALLVEYLTQHGYAVYLSQNGIEGLDDAKQLNPDLILLDLWLPGRPGEEVCKAIRADEDPRFRQTPILMVTAKDSEIDRAMGMLIGATGYLPKPFNEPVLLKEVEHCLEGR